MHSQQMQHHTDLHTAQQLILCDLVQVSCWWVQPRPCSWMRSAPGWTAAPPSRSHEPCASSATCEMLPCWWHCCSPHQKPTTSLMTSCSCRKVPCCALTNLSHRNYKFCVTEGTCFALAVLQTLLLLAIVAFYRITLMLQLYTVHRYFLEAPVLHTYTAQYLCIV